MEGLCNTVVSLSLVGPPAELCVRLQCVDAGKLLHRAAQRLHAATEEQAQKHGIGMRDYIVLSALHLTPSLTQVELTKTLGLDKTTLMTLLDRLEGAGLVMRRTDPNDRRARIPQITKTGNALRIRVSRSFERVEGAVLDGVSPEQVALLRQLLFTNIGDTADRGSCL